MEHGAALRLQSQDNRGDKRRHMLLRELSSSGVEEGSGIGAEGRVKKMV